MDTDVTQVDETPPPSPDSEAPETPDEGSSETPLSEPSSGGEGESGDEGTVGDETGGEGEQSTAARLAELEKTNRDLQIENAFWRGKGEQTRTEPEKPTEPAEPKDLSKAELEELLRTDPAEALIKVQEQAERRVEKRLRGENSAQTELQQIRTADEQNAYRLYPELAQNKEFYDRADKLVRLMHRRNGDKYLRGDISTAVAAVYGDMVREGMIDPPKREPKTTTTTTTGPRAEVRRVIQDPGLRRPATAPASNGNGKDPFHGLNFSKEERERITKRSAEFGVPLDRWRANYDASERERNGQS